jgi:hypothetical protein
VWDAEPQRPLVSSPWRAVPYFPRNIVHSKCGKRKDDDHPSKNGVGYHGTSQRGNDIDANHQQRIAGAPPFEGRSPQNSARLCASGTDTEPSSTCPSRSENNR